VFEIPAAAIHARRGDSENLSRIRLTGMSEQIRCHRNRFGKVAKLALMIRGDGVDAEHAGARLVGLRARAKQRFITH
jgi:hypothetical protein